MPTRTELNLRLPNSPGALGGVCRLLSDERVNILAMTVETGGQLRMVVDNHVHAAAVLRDHHHEVAERDVLVMAGANTPGALAPALRLIKDADINVEYAYSGVGETGNSASIVIGVEHVLKASSVAGV